MKWEYKILADSFHRAGLNDSLNEMGEQEWELVTVIHARSNFDSNFASLFIFKREITQPPADKQPECAREQTIPTLPHHQYKAGTGKPPVVSDDEKDILDQVY